MRFKPPKQTRLDKAIAYLNPVLGVKRYRAKCAVALAESYRGASKTRRSLSQWSTSDGDADSDILPELPDLRERSRDLIRNNALAKGSVSTKVTSVVGGGLTLQARIDRDVLNLTQEQADAWERKTEAEWLLWSDSKDSDIARTLNFREQQALAFLSVLENGDCFVLTPQRQVQTLPYKTRLQLIEADRVSNESSKQDTDRLSGGVQKDVFGAPEFYHILKGHPGNLYATINEWSKVRAFGKKTGRRNVLHLYNKLRIGQSRGVPDLAPVMEALKQLGTFTQSELDAAVISSFFTVFIKSEHSDELDTVTNMGDETGAKSSDKDFKMGPASMLELEPDEEIEIADPKRPNQAFEPFFMAITTQIGVALELPREILIKAFTSSYSAAQAALLEAWRFFMARRQWLIDNLCQPIYEIWLTEAVAMGRIAAPGFLNDPLIRAAYLGADWVGPPRGHIDPGKQNKADAEAEDRGWKTAAQNTQERAGNWERNIVQRKKEVNASRDAGLIEEVEHGNANQAE